MLRDIAELTAGDVELDPGNLYRSLKRLLEAALIQKSTRRPAPEADDERRQYYRLTAHGKKVAAAEARRMDALLSLSQTRKLLSEAKT